MSELSRFGWRGVLGGIIAPLAFVLVSAYRRPNDALAIAFLPIILLVTGIIGAVIGISIGLAHVVGKMRMRLTIRLVVGVGIAAVFWVLYRYLRGNDLGLSGWQLADETLLFSLVIGALPGILARPKDARNAQV